MIIQNVQLGSTCLVHFLTECFCLFKQSSSCGERLQTKHLLSWLKCLLGKQETLGFDPSISWGLFVTLWNRRQTVMVQSKYLQHPE